ncbi:chemotaxis response regulator protein-glutamate methylesterase [Laspinema palackyanum]|uniref:chemotaxis response regulator protein-glutamate methylesterase n=1 Tax=Laspinema palackyanum TaxID=3231601 RepID=UPI00345CCC50|nr:chemotaxis response regulator protein-glutamate methylesterase [Laspinema sp. D2c]
MKIAIVNDMLLAIEALRRVLTSVPDYELLWVARNGAEALDKCTSVRPDLILMDVFMPVMDGVEATRQIMGRCPCAILLVTSSINTHLPKVFEALGYGALDVVITPILGHYGNAEGGETLLEKIRTVHKLLGKPLSKKPRTPIPAKWSYPTQPYPSLVAIGASTGGPTAISKILSQLPQDFRIAVAIVQHIDVQFSASFVQWLSQQTRLKIDLAQEGMTPQPGKIIVAATNDHLLMRPDRTLGYTKHPRSNPYRPSVDVFFTSLAENWPGQGLGVLLTGMGRDGAIGLSLLRSAGWQTIAQDASSCIVYGMPKAAVELGAVQESLTPEAIGLKLLSL